MVNVQVLTDKSHGPYTFYCPFQVSEKSDYAPPLPLKPDEQKSEEDASPLLPKINEKTVEEYVSPLPLKVDDTYIKPPLGVNRNLTVFIGILTVDKKFEIRDHLRKMYKHNNGALARYLGVNESPVTIKFFTGHPKGKYKAKLEQESKKHGDIVILNIKENMNGGKTLKFFDWFAENRNDDYMLKVDDDSFVHLIHYYRDIQDLPRERAYYGFALNFTVHNKDPDLFMWGMGYTISRDLVMDIVGSRWVRSHAKGNEDNMIGRWMCKVARENKYLIHYVGFTHRGWPNDLFRNFRENPFHDVGIDSKNADPRFPDESIILHRMKSVKEFKAIEDVYFYNDGFPKIRVIRNSTTAGLITKKELFQGCWIMSKKNQTWKQALSWTQARDIYKNWFYEAWGFKEGRWYGHYGPKDKIVLSDV
ncbi:17331_t:CDS:2 [Acaulospora morrowiae]|uniref:Hexosyltransferase n=1 Tax=Acaulospora morrowiae TaxID=94023 RepID=A0A9N9G4A4_9GLOM|nr:17331_t:CDS:2 [Acaulospora morrowiae]